MTDNPVAFFVMFLLALAAVMVLIGVAFSIWNKNKSKRPQTEDRDIREQNSWAEDYKKSYYNHK